MGFIRGGLFVIVSVLFFILLLTINSLFVVTSSLDYNNLKQELIPVVKDALNEQINISQIIEANKIPLMQTFCANSSNELEYVFSEANYTFVLPCSALSNGTQGVIDSAIDGLFEQYYYKEYDCSFFDCMKEDSIPFFVVSEHSKNYWQAKIYYVILALVVLLALMFLLIEKKTNLPLVVGSLVILSSLLFAKLESFSLWLINTFTNVSPVSPVNVNNFLKFFSVIFTQSYKIFLIMVIAGVVVLAIGIILKFFAIGFKINEFFSKFGKKKEMAKEESKPKAKTKGKK